MNQPVKLDVGEGPVSSGCVPSQRSRIWPQDGLNCWEATGHYVGVALAQGLPVEVHVYDRDFGPFRHVYPAVRRIGDSSAPVPVLLQRSMPQPKRAQEWWNDVLGAVHLGGSAALGMFGMGGLVPAIESMQGGALPGWARISGPRPRAPSSPGGPVSGAPPGGPVPGAPPGGPVPGAPPGGPVPGAPPGGPAWPSTDPAYSAPNLDSAAGTSPYAKFSTVSEYLRGSSRRFDPAAGL